jgi:hypothetical protein
MAAPLAAPAPVASVDAPRATLSRWATLSLCAACLVPLLSFLVLFPLVTPMPTWDQWSLGPLWAAHFEGKPVLPLLLAPYNGHRNVLPRLFFYGLGRISGWNVRLEVVASYLVACVTLGLLLRMATRIGTKGLGIEGRLLALPIAAQAFCLLQYENFMSGYPFGQNLSQLLVTMVIFLLTRPILGTGAFVAAATAAMAATFSWGAGLAAFPAGLLALLLRGERRPVRWVVWTALTATAAGIVRQSAAGAFPPIPWGSLPAFFLTLLGKAWSPFAVPSPRVTVALGVVGLLLFAVTAPWAYLRDRERSLPWIVLGCGSLAAAGLISLGRTGAGIGQAFASHYVTTTYPLVVACLALITLLILDLRRDVPAAGLRSAALVVVAIGFTLQPALASRQSLVMVRGWDPIVRRNSLAIVRGTATDAQIRESDHPVPALVRDATEVLRAHRLAWFRELLDGEAPIGTVDRLAGQVGGAASYAVDGELPWTLEGWAVRSRHEGGPVRAVELFVDGRSVPATTILDQARDDVAAYYHSAGFRLSGWAMSVPADAIKPGDHRLAVVAVDFAGGRFPLLEAELQMTAAEVQRPAKVALRSAPPSHTLAAGA